MVTITIGDSERNRDEADESWINQQINRRRQEGQPVCLQVHIKDGYLDFRLATPGCGGGNRGRPPTPQEQRIVDLWEKQRLFTSEFTGGNVIAFLKQLDMFI